MSLELNQHLGKQLRARRSSLGLTQTQRQIQLMPRAQRLRVITSALIILSLLKLRAQPSHSPYPVIQPIQSSSLARVHQ